jgi:hypothetical protein
MPVWAISGHQARNALGGRYQKEVDLVSMFKDVAGAFVQHASTPGRRGDLVDRAVRIALGERPVTAIALPNDAQDMTYEDPPKKHGNVHSSTGRIGCWPMATVGSRSWQGVSSPTLRIAKELRGDSGWRAMFWLSGPARLGSCWRCG